MEKIEKLLSVIIPAYNSEKYIELCINSILNQTYKKIEVIVVDDESKDKTVEIVTNISKKDPRVKLFTQKNHGNCYTRNRGIELASGEYIAFIDNDDYLEPIMYETLISMIESDHSDVAAGLFIKEYKVLKEDKYYNYSAEDVKKAEKHVYDNTKDLIEHIIYIDNKLQGYMWNKVYKREVLKDLRFDVNLSLLEDCDFTLNLVLKENIKISAINLIFYHYRIFKNATTRSINFNKFENSFPVIRRELEETKKYCPQYAFATYSQYLSILFLYFEKLYQNKKYIDKKEYKKHIKIINEHIDFCLQDKKNIDKYTKIRIYTFKFSKLLCYLIFSKLKNFVRNNLMR